MLYCAIITSKDSAPNEITETLRTWASGNAEALDSLAPLVYDRMRRLAASFLRHERHDHTLQTTALIHEAFLRLVQQQRVTYENREQFFANAGRMMRRILVDHARARSVRKRGSGAEPLPIEVAKQLPIPERPLDMLALDDALQELTATHPDLGLIVELKFFVGLSVAETAAVTGRGSATVQRRWQLARSWLYRRLDQGSTAEASASP